MTPLPCVRIALITFATLGTRIDGAIVPRGKLYEGRLKGCRVTVSSGATAVVPADGATCRIEHGLIGCAP